MRKISICFLIAVGLLIGAADVRSQDRNSVTGFVFDETRRPVAELYVELQNDFYSPVARVRTGGSGMYAFRNLPSGRYHIKVLNSGTDLEEQVKAVSLIPISAVEGRGAAAEQVDFYLRSRKQAASIPGNHPGVVFAQETPPAAKSLYEAGINDLEAKKDAGLEKIKRSIEIFPEYFLALDRLGREYVTRGFYEPAYVLLIKAVAVNPRSFSSTLGLGLAEYRLGQKQSAIERFQSAVVLDKSSINAHLWLGIALQQKPDIAGSLAALLTADKLSGGGVPEIHWQLARVYKEQKKFASAANELEIFLKLRPDAQNAEAIRKIIDTLRIKA